MVNLFWGQSYGKSVFLWDNNLTTGTSNEIIVNFIDTIDEYCIKYIPFL